LRNKAWASRDDLWQMQRHRLVISLFLSRNVEHCATARADLRTFCILIAASDPAATLKNPHPTISKVNTVKDLWNRTFKEK
jgi:hypothetical protein